MHTKVKDTTRSEMQPIFPLLNAVIPANFETISAEKKNCHLQCVHANEACDNLRSDQLDMWL